MNARLLVVFLVTSIVSLRGAGFTEPPITFYGKVTQNAEGYDFLFTSGQLAWTIQPSAGGTPFVLTTPLSALNGGYSYRLQIPVEKVPNGFTLSVATIPAGALASYNRDQVTLDGAPLTIVSAASNFTFAETQRGKTERVDLAFTAAFLDSDHDGLPDWWEMQYGYDPTDPGDGSGDSDGDGKTALQEYLSGTNPLDGNDHLRVTRVIKPGGIDVTWTSVAGRKYQVLSAATVYGTYTAISGIITAGPGETTKSYTHTPAPGEVRRFYKVVLVP
jgi:hypothetical protein